MGKTLQAETALRSWPTEGWTRVPFWVYTDPAIFEREMDKFFYGPSWNYVALDCEVPEPGSFKRSWIGTRQVIVVRTMYRPAGSPSNLNFPASSAIAVFRAARNA